MYSWMYPLNNLSQNMKHNMYVWYWIQPSLLFVNKYYARLAVVMVEEKLLVYLLCFLYLCQMHKPCGDVIIISKTLY